MKKLLFVLVFVAAALPLFPQEWEIKLEDYYPAGGDSSRKTFPMATTRLTFQN